MRRVEKKTPSHRPHKYLWMGQLARHDCFSCSTSRPGYRDSHSQEEWGYIGWTGITVVHPGPDWPCGRRCASSPTMRRLLILARQGPALNAVF